MTAPIVMDAATRRRSHSAAILALVRWPNAVMAMAGVLLGAWWVDGELGFRRDLALAVVAAFLATAAFNALNDVMDRRIDEVAHPDRPLPRGELSHRAATYIGWGSWFLAQAAAGAANTMVAVLMLGALVAGAVYALGLSRRGLFGNAIVAIVASMPFVVGAAAVGDLRPGLPLLAVAVPLHLARELVKDLADAAGDAGHRRTVALGWGAGVARGLARMAVATYAVVASLLFAPAGLTRLALAPSVAAAAWAVARDDAREAARLLKLSMLLAMAALPFLR